MVWATAADVQAITGATVDDAAVQRAHYVIELTSGGRVAVLDTTRLSSRNLYWLKLAVAYQTAWMVEHPDYFTRMDVTTYTQDGLSASLRPDGLTLAPNARKAMKRLSWRGMRTINPTSGQTYHVNVATSDDYDDNLPWRAV